MKRIVTLILLICIGVGVLGVVSFFMTSPQSLEEKLCNQFEKESSVCIRILHVDSSKNLVFYLNNNNTLMHAKLNDSFTKVVNWSGGVEFNSFVNSGESYIWQGSQNDSGEPPPKIYGLARDEVKSIIIESEGNIQPNRIYIGDGIWLWYVELTDSNKINLPITIKTYDEKGEQLDLP